MFNITYKGFLRHARATFTPDPSILVTAVLGLLLRPLTLKSSLLSLPALMVIIPMGWLSSFWTLGIAAGCCKEIALGRELGRNPQVSDLEEGPSWAFSD